MSVRPAFTATQRRFNTAGVNVSFKCDSWEYFKCLQRERELLDLLPDGCLAKKKKTTWMCTRGNTRHSECIFLNEGGRSTCWTPQQKCNVEEWRDVQIIFSATESQCREVHRVKYYYFSWNYIAQFFFKTREHKYIVVSVERLLKNTGWLNETSL